MDFVNFVMALSPILVVLVGILGFKQSAKRVSPIALVWTLILAFTYFNVTGASFADNVKTLDPLVWKGIKEGLKIVLMVFGAFTILNLLRETGAIDDVKSTIARISDDRRVQLIVIGMMLLKRGSHTSIGHVNLIWNLALYAICAAAFNLSTAIYSILFSFISTTAMDKLHMQNINVEVTVVTKVLSPEMEHEILVDLHRGITRYEGVGEYTGQPVHIFYILVTKYEISRLRAIVCKHDPHAFIVAKDGAVVYGNYKRKI